MAIAMVMKLADKMDSLPLTILFAVLLLRPGHAAKIKGRGHRP